MYLGFLGLYTAMVWSWPWWCALIATALGGTLWGTIPGLFKALLNVHEVITSIMFASWSSFS